MIATSDKLAYRSARPAIVVGGREDAMLASRLLGLLIVENVQGLYRCEALFGNWGPKNNNIGFLYFDRDTIDFGKSLRIQLGQDTLFDGRIMGLEANFPDGSPPQMNVLAEDRLQDLRMTRRTRTFVDLSDADVMRQIANEHGLSPEVDLPGPKHKVLAQVNLSDLAFLRERARAIGAELWVQGNSLRAASRSRRQGETYRMTFGRELREFSVLADLADQRTSVSVNGWDVSSKSGLHFEATDSILGGELNGDRSGASVLSSALGTRKESLVHTMPVTTQQAQAEAEAYFKLTARRFVRGRGQAQADGRLRVGNQVDLQGLGPLFSGKYYLSEVRHSLDVHGFRTEFTVERAGLGRN